MDMPNDFYKTIALPTQEILLKEKKSKFYGIAYPILTEDEVRPLVEAQKKKHRTANHVCYAWVLGVEDRRYRANDDGEPNNSAGMPIYGQLQSFELTNVLLTVTRIFGGTKLGVGGLISAYRETAKLTLEAANIVQRTVRLEMAVLFGYSQMDAVMRLIKQQQLDMVSQKMELDCQIVVWVQKSRSEALQVKFEEIFGVTATCAKF